METYDPGTSVLMVCGMFLYVRAICGVIFTNSFTFSLVPLEYL